MSDDFPKCRRCLLSEITDKAVFYRDMVQHIDKLPERSRTPKIVYEQRLQTCKTCDALNDGTCMQCGCYVEMRAAAKKAHCPMRRW